MKGSQVKRTIAGLVLVVGIAVGQTGPGTTFFFGTHHAADQVLQPYGAGLPGWYLVRAPQPASYYSFHNLLDVHSVTVYRNGVALTAQQVPRTPEQVANGIPGEPSPDYGWFVISDPAGGGGYAVVVVLAVPTVSTDRLRVSYSYVQE